MTDTEKERLDFANRLNKVLDEKGYAVRGRAQKVLAETGLEISDRAINKWLKGESIPDHTNLAVLSRFYDVSFDWLATGNGMMDKRSEITKQPVKSNLEILSDGNLRKVPIINMVQAGQWTASFDNRYDEFIEVPDVYGRDVFGLRIDGFSMIPDFYPDDIVFIDPNIEPLNGDYVIAANASYESTFKRYKKHYNLETSEEWFELIPSNAEFTVIDSRIDPFQIIGVAVGRHQFFRRGRN